MVATRVELQCPNGHPKVLLITLAFISAEPETVSDARVRCGVCGAVFGLPTRTQHDLLAMAGQAGEPVSATTA